METPISAKDECPARAGTRERMDHARNFVPGCPGILLLPLHQAVIHPPCSATHAWRTHFRYPPRASTRLGSTSNVHQMIPPLQSMPQVLLVTSCPPPHSPLFTSQNLERPAVEQASVGGLRSHRVRRPNRKWVVGILDIRRGLGLVMSTSTLLLSLLVVGSSSTLYPGDPFRRLSLPPCPTPGSPRF